MYENKLKPKEGSIAWQYAEVIQDSSRVSDELAQVNICGSGEILLQEESKAKIRIGWVNRDCV